MIPIQLIQLHKDYKSKKGKKVVALKDLSLEITSGEVFGFLGPNGAGKSTAIKTLMGLITPSAGHAALCGISCANRASRRNVGYLPENPSFYDLLTAREYLAFVGKAFEMDAAGIVRESMRVLELLELSEAADRPIRGYSKGMVQRLGLAQALLHDPDVYILDEPMSGLDPLGRSLVKEIIKGLKMRGKTVFFSTHVTADIEATCDRVGVIVKGQLRAVDSVDNILQKGIEGYFVQLRKGTTLYDEVYVEKEDLRRFLVKDLESDVVVERIEPKRKDMEAFFLEIVTKEKNAVNQ